MVHEAAAPAGSVGYRLTRHRSRCGLSRIELATRAELDPALILDVEQGRIPASAGFTGAVARALGVEVDVLYGQPYGPALTDPAADHAPVPALRAALDSDDDPPPASPALSVAQLRTRLDTAEQDRGAARYRQLGAALPELLHHGHVLAARAHPGDQAQTAAALLADAYLLARTVAYRFGYLDLAALANHRARQAADRSADPLRVAVAAGQRALLRLHRGDYFGVLLLTERTHHQITDQTHPAADAVRVALHLREALAYARLGNADQAEGHLTRARKLIGRGIPASPYYTVTATEATVDIHTVAVPLELGDPTTALSRADQIKIPTGKEPARLGRYWIDLARAATLAGDPTQALDALHQARVIAPQLTRYHPQARETLHLLAEHDRRAPDTLAGFARWAHITH
ncbi:MAG: helix-turn-helix domain-containing protein [Pseudonocardiaceae bacterium]